MALQEPGRQGLGAQHRPFLQALGQGAGQG